jgi:hypothetical protein
MMTICWWSIDISLILSEHTGLVSNRLRLSRRMLVGIGGPIDDLGWILSIVGGAVLWKRLPLVRHRLYSLDHTISCMKILSVDFQFYIHRGILASLRDEYRNMLIIPH